MIGFRETTREGISPVVGIILMVAVTVILSATVGVFVFNLAPNESEQAQTAGVSLTQSVDATNTRYVELQVVSSSSSVYYQVESQDPVEIGSSGEGVTLYEGEDYTAGDTITVLSSKTNGKVLQSITTESTAANSTLQEGLVAYWTFNENASTGTAVDSVQSHDGTISGATYTSGKHDSALFFQNGSYVHVPESTDFNTSELTLVAWIRPQPSPDNYEKRIVNRNSVVGGEAWEFSADDYASGPGMRALLHNTSGDDVPFSGESITPQKWNLVALTYDTDESVLYVNGSAIARNESLSGSLSDGQGGVYLGTPAWNIGVPRYSFNGTIDDVRVYNRSLSAAELAALYDQRK